ncbi:hypothetical protein MNBD_CHLOROFLEXI01-4936 [hydrothermal vent metagenome]|uniref:Bacterial transcriptional activator domain-containing protein n=1 Tax=hydrothermal vent metagenome TaxID=652676 RepID=A0A3B0VP71_9ZZZZ
MISLHIRMLGKIQIYDSEQTPITLPLKAQELLVYLFVHCNQPHEREKLSAQLWPNVPENRSKKYLRQALWQLQTMRQDTQSPECGIIQLEGSWVQFNLTNNIWIDADQFCRAFTQMRDVPAQAMSVDQIAAVSEAVELYGGEFVTSWYHDWCLLERERLQSMLLTMLDKLIDYCLLNKQFERGIAYGMQMLRYDKARERSHRRLMRLYYLADNRTVALRQYDLCTATLMQELNVQPSQKTTALYQHIQADEGHNLKQLSSPTIPTLPAKPEASTPLLTLLHDIHLKLTTLQQDMQSLKQALNLTKDASADS